MNQSKLMTSLIKEALEFIQYSRLPKYVTALLIIALSPIIIATTILVCDFYIMVFILKVFSTPCDYLLNFIKTEGKEVHWLAQAVIYAIGFPLIFIFKIYIAFMTVSLMLSWFIINCLIYTITLGGIRFQPYLLETTFESNATYTLKPSIDLAKIWSIISIVAFALFICGIVFIYAELNHSFRISHYDYMGYPIYTRDPAPNATLQIIGYVFVGIYALSIILTNVVFRKKQIMEDNQKTFDETK